MRFRPDWLKANGDRPPSLTKSRREVPMLLAGEGTTARRLR